MRAEATQSGRAAVAFTVANFCGAALNYLFQVHAAAVLDSAAFGTLSAWLAVVTTFGTIVTFVQFLSLEARMDDARWPPIARLAGLASLAMLVLHLVSGRAASPLALGATATVGAIALAALVGQLQSRLMLGVIAAAVVVTAGLRFTLPFAWAPAERAPAFYLAHAASSYGGMTVIGLFALRGRSWNAVSESSPQPKKNDDRIRVARPLLLGFATAVFPYLDILAISAVQDAATTGAFSRIALVARAIFFGGMAGLAVLLPHQLHATTRGEKMPWFAVLLERFLPAAVVAGSIPVMLVLDAGILHTSGEERTWLYASGLAAATSVAILGEVNRLAARGEVGRAATFVALTLAASFVGLSAAMFHPAGSEGVARYIAVAFVGNAVVLVVARLVTNAVPSEAVR